MNDEFVKLYFNECGKIYYKVVPNSEIKAFCKTVISEVNGIVEKAHIHVMLHNFGCLCMAMEFDVGKAEFEHNEKVLFCAR